MTDIRHVWITSCGRVEGTLPLRNVLGEALKGRLSFEAWNHLFSFQSYVGFYELFLFPTLLKDLAPNLQALGLLVSTMSWTHFEKLHSVTRQFLRTPTTTTSIFWKFSFFFPKQSLCYLSDSYGDPPGWAKHFGDGTSTTTMSETWLLGIGKIERRRTVDCCRDWYESRAMGIHGSKEKKNTRKSSCDCANSQPFVIYILASFVGPVFETWCHGCYRFARALRCYRCTAQVGQPAVWRKQRIAVIRDISGVDHRGVTNLSAPMWFTESFIDQRWAWEESVRAEKRDRDAEIEKEPTALSPELANSICTPATICNLLMYIATPEQPAAYLFITRTSHLNHTRPQNAPHTTHKFRVLLLNARTQPSFDQTDDGVDAETSLSLSLHL